MLRYVYFIRNERTGAIKIGTAGRVRVRLQQLQTASADRLALLGAVVGREQLEREYHARFSAERMAGEWFEPSERLLFAISRELAERGVSEPRSDRPDPDAHTKQGAQWIEYLLRRESVRQQASLDSCVGDLAQKLGVTPGLIYNLRRGRIHKITVSDFESIRLAAIAEFEGEIAELHGKLDGVRSLASISEVMARAQSLHAQATGREA